MLTEALTPRQQRGLVIAATAQIKRRKRTFDVPSQSNAGVTYVVAQIAGEFSCTCPDFELTGQTCKHGFAVQYLLKLERAEDGTVTETRAVRVTYPQPWAAYNRAQVSEKDAFCTLLRDLVADVPSPEQKRGRPALPLPDMLFSAAFKVYSTVSARRFMTDLRAAMANGLIDRTPHYNSIFNVLDRDSVTWILHDLITRAALPLKALETTFAVDSTGFGTQQFYRHYNAKYGREQIARDYLKLHAMVGTKTNVVTAAQVTDRNTHDAPVLPTLVNVTSDYFDVQQVSADKGYSSYRNLEAITAVGAEPFVAFKINANGASKSALWNKLFHFFQMNREVFLTRYHSRSNIESTFSAIKRKFGDTIRSKTPTAQRNELLLKVLCHNIVCLIHEIHESDASGVFPALIPACPQTDALAQNGLNS